MIALKVVIRRSVLVIQHLTYVSDKDRQALSCQFLLYLNAWEPVNVFLKQFWHVDHIWTLFIMTHVSGEHIKRLTIELEVILAWPSRDYKCLKPPLEVEWVQPHNACRQVIIASTHLLIQSLHLEQFFFQRGLLVLIEVILSTKLLCLLWLAKDVHHLEYLLH